MSFFFIVLTVLSLMYAYVGWRLIGPAPVSLPVTLLLWALLVVFLVLPFLGILMRMREAEGTLVDVITWVGYFSFGFFTLLFAIVLAKDVVLMLILIGQKSAHWLSAVFSSSAWQSETVDPVRRSFVANSINVGVLSLTGALTGYGLFQALRRPDVVQVTVPIKNLPADLDGFRIVQITDIHASATIKRGFVETVVGMVNELKPDLVALTGDLVDGSVHQLGYDVAPLAELQAPHGKFFITGNHEYYSGVQQWVDETARLGFTVLLNEHRVIERGDGRFLLAGVTDYSGGQFRKDHATDPHKAMRGAPKTDATILLAHQPKSIFEAAKVGFDYVISGHTHGGQYFPYHFLVALTQPYISGLHRYENTHIYVSKGTGYWGPQLRIGARSEITVHTLKPV